MVEPLASNAKCVCKADLHYYCVHEDMYTMQADFTAERVWQE